LSRGAEEGRNEKKYPSRRGGASVKKIKEIAAFAILICLALASIQTVLADNPVSTTTIYGPFPPSQFDSDFFHITEASVTLSSGTYTFEMRMKSTPPDWMTGDWQPKYAPPNGHTRISMVAYHWQVYDASGNFLGILEFAWHLGDIELDIVVCPPSANHGCLASVGIGAGLGYRYYYPKDLKSGMTPIVDQEHNSVSVIISQSDLEDLFPASTPPTQWRALSGAAHVSVAPYSASFVIYYAAIANLPTT
jgi:hypothetical protein